MKPGKVQRDLIPQVPADPLTHLAHNGQIVIQSGQNQVSHLQPDALLPVENQGIQDGLELSRADLLIEGFRKARDEIKECLIRGLRKFNK